MAKHRPPSIVSPRDSMTTKAERIEEVSVYLHESVQDANNLSADMAMAYNKLLKVSADHGMAETMKDLSRRANLLRSDIMSVRDRFDGK